MSREEILVYEMKFRTIGEGKTRTVVCWTEFVPVLKSNLLFLKVAND